LPVLFSEMGHSPDMDFFSQGCNACWRSLKNELPLGEHGVLKPQISCLSQVGRLCIY
jgi:hypothetical protein